MNSTIRVYRMIGTLFVLSHLSLSAVAAPVTYQFQATVRPLPPFNDDVGLPFTLEEGSVIDGLLTVDPDLEEPAGFNASESVQPFEIALSFQGFSFGAEMYSTRVFNDRVIADNPSFSEADLIKLTCSSSSLDVACSATPLQFPGSPPLTFSMTTEFYGDIGLLQQPQLPTDVDTWNGFTFERTMTIRFITATGQVAGYFTNLNSFSIIPEPSSHVLVVVLLIQLLLCRRNFKAEFSD